MVEKIQSLVPANVYQQLNDVISKFSINTSLRLAHFLSQTSHESGGFTKTHENLNYSAAGLANTWPGRFGAKDANGNYIKNDKKKVLPNALALQIEHKPQDIANNAYASRYGNGDVSSADGWKYAGKGYIMTTFKANYQEFYKSIGLDPNTDPSFVETKYPLLSAAYFWGSHHLNLMADAGSADEDIDRISAVVNGGTIGQVARREEFHKFYSKLSV